MRFPIKTAAILLLGAAGVVAYAPAQQYWKARHRPQYTDEQATRGAIAYVVNSTGTVQPVLSVHIGSFVSGPIEKLYVDFNQPVKKGELLAKIDPRIYAAGVLHDQAFLVTRQADRDRAKAVLQQAINDEKRAEALMAKNKDYVSATEMDQFRLNRMSLEAQLKVADATVKQAEASL
jgi:HlyD family secretion protein